MTGPIRPIPWGERGGSCRRGQKKASFCFCLAPLLVNKSDWIGQREASSWSLDLLPFSRSCLWTVSKMGKWNIYPADKLNILSGMSGCSGKHKLEGCCICWLQQWFITNGLADDTGGLAIKGHQNSFVLPAKWCLDFSSRGAASEMSSRSFCCLKMHPVSSNTPQHWAVTAVISVNLFTSSVSVANCTAGFRHFYGRTFILILYANSSVITLPFILLAIKRPKCAVSGF